MSKIRQLSIKWVPFGSVVLFSQYGLSGATQNKGKYPVLRMGNLEELGIKGFSVDTWKTHYIHLKSDKFNDYGYRTKFHIHEDSRIGSVKIGYKAQTPEKRDTKDKLPQYFPFLRDNFFFPC